MADHPSTSTLPQGMTHAEMQAIIDSHYWHHAMDFGNGLATTKSNVSPESTKALAATLLTGLDLVGKSLIDIGAWNGAYSFAAKRKGAARVVACDKVVWDHDVLKGRQTFDLARRLLGLEVEAYEIDLPFVTPDVVGMYDVVLFSGVFYHLLEAVRLTRQISRCATHMLVLETHQDALDNPRPAMIFYPHDTLGGDGSNWWGPNPHCLYELLSEFGFGEIHYRHAPGFLTGGRGIYHAYRDLTSMAAMGVSGPQAPWVSLSDPEARRQIFTPG